MSMSWLICTWMKSTTNFLTVTSLSWRWTHSWPFSPNHSAFPSSWGSYLQLWKTRSGTSGWAPTQSSGLKMREKNLMITMKNLDLHTDQNTSFTELDPPEDQEFLLMCMKVCQLAKDPLLRWKWQYQYGNRGSDQCEGERSMLPKQSFRRKSPNSSRLHKEARHLWYPQRRQ